MAQVFISSYSIITKKQKQKQKKNKKKKTNKPTVYIKFNHFWQIPIVYHYAISLFAL